MSQPAPYSIAREPMPDHEQKQAALSYLNEAWAEARHEGVDGDCLAQASMFAALAELVTTYGEDAVAKFAEGLPARVRNGEDFESDVERVVRTASPAPLWIAWPKQSSGVKTDLTQNVIREFGLAAGWVDFKICAIDETWSGLAFARRPV